MWSGFRATLNFREFENDDHNLFAIIGHVYDANTVVSLKQW